MMKHDHQQRQNRSCHFLLWAGLVALGHISISQTAQAVEQSQQDDHDDNILKRREDCLAKHDWKGYIKTLNTPHVNDEDPNQCVNAIARGLQTFAMTVDKATGKKVFDESNVFDLFLSETAKNLPDSFLLEFGTRWYSNQDTSCVETLRGAGVLENRDQVESILSVFEAGQMQAFFANMLDWLSNQDPQNYAAKNLLSDYLCRHDVQKMQDKGFDILSQYHQDIIAHIMTDSLFGEQKNEKAHVVAQFIQATIWNDRGEEFLTIMQNHDFWDYLESILSSDCENDQQYGRSLMSRLEYAYNTHYNEGDQGAITIAHMIDECLESAKERKIQNQEQ